jgi:hypothetical protein
MNRREEIMLRYKLKLKRQQQEKKQREIAMLRQSLPKLEKLISSTNT